NQRIEPSLCQHGSRRQSEKSLRIDYSSSGNTIATVFAPASTYRISPLIPEARSEHRNAAALPTSSMVTLRRNGALAALASSIMRNFLMPDAARVRIGPAEIPLTRIPSGPRLDARYRTLASRLALASPMTL